MYGESCGLKSIIKGEYRDVFIPVPLKSINISCQLINYVAEVTVLQEYLNVEEGPIECEYMFPIEEESAVIEFTATLEGKTLVSKVKPNEEAEKDYKEAISKGKTGFLAQSVRSDILQIKVGHLSPGARCTISLTYILEAALDTGKIRLTIPTTISPKYVPFHDHSEEAKKIQSIKYDFSTPAPMTFSMEASMKSKIEEVSSPSHKIQTNSSEALDSKGLYTSKTELSSTTSDLDRDIVMLVKCESASGSAVLREQDNDSTILMVSLVPSLIVKSDPNLDVVFLIDCSGSMGGSSIKLARDAINILLHSLPSTVHFNIVRFGSSYKKLFDESVAYSDKTLTKARSAMKELEANLGGTEILTPLRMLLEEKTKVPRRVFVLTDGSVSNSMECLKLARRHNNNTKVFALGIGSSADRHLVKGLARAGLGTSEFTTEEEMIAPKVIKQLKHCLQPNLKDVTINWGESIDTTNSSQAPSTVPSLYTGSRVQVFRAIDNKNASIPSVVKISAEISGQDDDGYAEEIAVDDSVLKGNLLHKMFARKMIQELEEREEMEDKSEVKELITELAMKYQLMSKHTSIVAVDTKENKSSQPMQSRSIHNQVPHGFHGGYRSAPMNAMAMGRRMAPNSVRMFCAAPTMSAPSYRMELDGMERISSPSSRMMKKSKMKESNLMLKQHYVEDEDDEEQEDNDMDMDLLACDSRGSGDDSCEELCDVSSDESPMDKVVSLISLQTAEGYFNKHNKIFTLLKLEEADFNAIFDGTSTDPKVMYTLLIVLALQVRFSDLQACWELVAEKAEAYLSKQSVPDDIREKIQKLIEK